MAERRGHEPVLRLSLLGTVRVSTPSAEIERSDVGGRKPIEVLLLLALAGSKPASKESIATALWPGTMPRSAFSTIESYVSVLRRRLFTDRTVARRVLSTTASGYQLSIDEVELDLAIFDESLRAADGALSVRSEVELRSLAAAIPRGVLAEDFASVDWLEADRRLYHDRVVRNLQLLAEARLQIADFANAIRDAEEVLRLEPYAEAAYRVKMLGSYALGQEEIARLTFDQCRSALASELGRDCTTVTESLAAAIDAGEAPSRILWSLRTGWASEIPPVRVGAVVANGAAGATGPDRRHPRGRLPFVGRDDVLDQLCEVVTVASRGALRIALLTGPWGAGRTSVLRQVEEMFPLISGATSYGLVDAELRPLPLTEPLLDALARRGHEELAEPYLGGPRIRRDGAAFERLAEVLHLAGPLLLLLDDIDLADMETVEAIQWLRDNAADAPVAIVASSRGVPRERPRLFDELPTDLLVALAPLDEAAVAPLGPLAERVRSVCGGNPAFMCDLWRWVSIGGSGVPASLRRKVHGRARALDEVQFDLLAGLAVMSEPATAAALARAVGMSPRRVAPVLRSLAALGLVEETADGVRFTQPVVRDVMAAGAHANVHRETSARPLKVS